MSKFKASEYFDNQRTDWIKKAEDEAAFIDSVFMINYYNKVVNSHNPRYKTNDIEPKDVFDSYDEVEYDNCLLKSKLLLTSTSYVGAASWNYKNADTYENAYSKMKKSHPGFNENSYELTAKHSRSQMKW